MYAGTGADGQNGKTVPCAESDCDIPAKSVPKKRKYNKVLACFYCGKLLKMKMQRHLISVHKNEREVAELLAVEGPKLRCVGFARLRNRGNFNHNTTVLESRSGSLVCARKTRRFRSPRKYLPCVHCLSMFLAKDLLNHTRRCPMNRSSGDDGTTRRSVRGSARCILDGVLKGSELRVPAKFRSEILEKNALRRNFKNMQNG